MPHLNFTVSIYFSYNFSLSHHKENKLGDPLSHFFSALCCTLVVDPLADKIMYVMCFSLRQGAYNWSIHFKFSL